MYPRDREDINNRGRRLLSFSRFPATPRVLLFDLSADGRTFAVNEEPPPPTHWLVVVDTATARDAASVHIDFLRFELF